MCGPGVGALPRPLRVERRCRIHLLVARGAGTHTQQRTHFSFQRTQFSSIQFNSVQFSSVQRRISGGCNACMLADLVRGVRLLSGSQRRTMQTPRQRAADLFDAGKVQAATLGTFVALAPGSRIQIRDCVCVHRGRQLPGSIRLHSRSLGRQSIATGAATLFHSYKWPLRHGEEFLYQTERSTSQ